MNTGGKGTITPVFKHKVALAARDGPGIVKDAHEDTSGLTKMLIERIVSGGGIETFGSTEHGSVIA